MPDEDFVRNLTGCQSRLLAFIASLLPDFEAAQDVLQNTNVVLWRKADQFAPGTSFMAWACQAARLEVLAHLRNRGRDRHLFDAEMVGDLATDATGQAERTDNLSLFLDQCLSLCSAEERELLTERYAPGGSVQEIAERHQQTPGQLSTALSRLRRRLMQCVENKLAAEEKA